MTTLGKAPIIQLVRVSKDYGKGRTIVHALRDITLSIPQGAYWSIMGRSGSGKSTLLHLLGLLDRPSSGQLQIGSETISATTDLSRLAILRRQFVGFIFQQFYLLPRLTALENVMLPGLYAGTSSAVARDRARQLLGDVQLADRGEHTPNQLSGGEQQRVAIARALMNDPAIILADEPTGNLDSASGARILEIIDSLRENGKTILVVTHDAEIGARADRIEELQDGGLK